MTQSSLVSGDRRRIVERLGGAAIESSAREAKAFVRARAVGTAVDLLRLVPAYALGRGGLRSTAARTGAGEIRIADRAQLQPERIAAVPEAGGDVVVRAGWKNTSLDTCASRRDAAPIKTCLTYVGAYGLAPV